MPEQRKRHYDLVIVGAGILGLAHALIAGRRGLKRPSSNVTGNPAELPLATSECCGPSGSAPERY